MQKIHFNVDDYNDYNNNNNGTHSSKHKQQQRQQIIDWTHYIWLYESNCFVKVEKNVFWYFRLFYFISVRSVIHSHHHHHYLVSFSCILNILIHSFVVVKFELLSSLLLLVLEREKRKLWIIRSRISKFNYESPRHTHTHNDSVVVRKA